MQHEMVSWLALCELQQYKYSDSQRVFVRGSYLDRTKEAQQFDRSRKVSFIRIKQQFNRCVSTKYTDRRALNA